MCTLVIGTAGVLLAAVSCVYLVVLAANVVLLLRLRSTIVQTPDADVDADQGSVIGHG